jgi:photosystem II stability/assembly factor-like uncharacterized protein
MSGTIAGYRGSMLRTRDGGATWVPQATVLMQNLWGISFADSNTGIAVGEAGAILRTTDGGRTWDDQTIPPTTRTTIRLSGVSFGSPMTGVVVGKLDTLIDPLHWESRSLILRSTDGGASWMRAPVSSKQWLSAVSFGDSSTATSVGREGLVLRTTDGGASWSRREVAVTSVNLNGVSSVGSQTVTVVGDNGTILRTADGGVTWRVQASGTTRRLNGVWFVDEVIGRAVGERGTVLRTSNGGATWVPQTSGTTNVLYAVFFSDANRGVIAGESGTILRTTAGNVPTIVIQNRESYSPVEFGLAQNYPNPFNATTNLEFWISEFEIVTLRVYDMLGREIATLVEQEVTPGRYRIRFDAGGLSSGVYYYRLEAGGISITKKFIVLR